MYQHNNEMRLSSGRVGEKDETLKIAREEWRRNRRSTSDRSKDALKDGIL